MADDPGGHLVVPGPPERHPLVPLDHGLAEAVQGVLGATPVEVHQVHVLPPGELVERLPELRAHRLDAAPPGGLEPRPVPQHRADRLEVPRGEVPEHLKLAGHQLDAEGGPRQQPNRGLQVTGGHLPRRLLHLEAGVLQPQLCRLVDGLEHELVPVCHLLRHPLQGEQGAGAHVARVVRVTVAGEDGFLEILLGSVSAFHGRSLDVVLVGQAHRGAVHPMLAIQSIRNERIRTTFTNRSHSGHGRVRIELPMPPMEMHGHVERSVDMRKRGRTGSSPACAFPSLLPGR
ncbi:MAG: hypothetical protein QOD01_113 [Actinomycetota bacterium]|jgi:hypothetical protein|nr:hypothetical protein [Actinomycetota bacterium]